MPLKGMWTGFLFFEMLEEYIENELFQIEFLSIDAENKITASITEECQGASLRPAGDAENRCFNAKGEYRPLSGEFSLRYELPLNNGGLRNVELFGYLNESEGLIKGRYRSYPGLVELFDTEMCFRLSPF